MPNNDATPETEVVLTGPTAAEEQPVMLSPVPIHAVAGPDGQPWIALASVIEVIDGMAFQLREQQNTFGNQGEIEEAEKRALAAESFERTADYFRTLANAVVGG